MTKPKNMLVIQQALIDAAVLIDTINTIPDSKSSWLGQAAAIRLDITEALKVIEAMRSPAERGTP